MYHCRIYECLTLFCQSFVIFTQTSISTQPSKCTLYHLSVGKYFKTFDVITALYDFQHPPTNYFDPINQLTGISSISPNKLQSRKCPLNVFQNKFSSISILDLSLIHISEPTRPY